MSEPGDDAFAAAWREQLRGMADSKIGFMLIADYPDDAIVAFVAHLVDEATAREMIATRRARTAAFLESDVGKRFMARAGEQQPPVGTGSRDGERT